MSHADAITTSTTIPSEKPPNNDTYVWHGDNTDPRYITIPTINTN